ncbi:MAG TPA: zf-HC2 domain-containing protein [Blastocatellia bacterium]|nr:zf-HC2 domain-containing protein [Blastocatellia bacterium]
MRCDQYQSLLSDYIDGCLELGEQTKLERHIGECEGCREIRDDLLQIVYFSRNLPMHTPSSSLWNRINSEIEQPRGSILTFPWLTRSIQRLSQGLKWRSQWMTAALALAAVVALVSALFYTVGPRRAQVITPPQSLSAANTDDSARNMEDLEQQIGKLKTVVDQQSATWNPELRSAFDRDLSYVDQTLVQCHHDLIDNPNDDVCREMMLNAYREKVRLLEGFTDF